MKITMLGTGNALVTECYNTCFVIEDNGQYFMVDGGGGSTILHQLKHAGYDWMDMRHIFDPYEKHHSTVKDACELAEKLNIRNLLLYHTEDKNLDARKKLYLEEGSCYYHGNLFIPDDLESVEL